ncbi:PH domain-containing protein [Flavobacterium sp.]|uniref:PH domain-containing protein n=1 Tax=Flavobacterium sp. TaxID=239 RepID=UPI002614EB59|nr:PH domain-containing protein [Flavobacterium sp.]
MENFSNETIDTKQLPRFEEVQLTALHPKYSRVVVLNSSIFILLLIIGLASLLYFDSENISNRFAMILGIATVIISMGILFFSILGFKKKAYAFRNHDVIYRSGIIATNTMVVPYNRVQHVALHEGFISRFFGLATVEIFTAGGSSSDVEIPGIAKEEAENIKQLLMGKIQKQL